MEARKDIVMAKDAAITLRQQHSSSTMETSPEVAPGADWLLERLDAKFDELALRQEKSFRRILEEFSCAHQLSSMVHGKRAQHIPPPAMEPLSAIPVGGAGLAAEDDRKTSTCSNPGSKKHYYSNRWRSMTNSRQRLPPPAKPKTVVESDEAHPRPSQRRTSRASSNSSEQQASGEWSSWGIAMEEKVKAVELASATSWYAWLHWNLLLQMQKWLNIEEPFREGRLLDLVYSVGFQGLSALVITLHAIVTALATNHEVAHWRDDFDLSSCVERCVTFRAAEVCFTLFYTFELGLKLIVHRQYYFCNEDQCWNWFDCFLVFSAFYDHLFFFFLSGTASGTNLTFMRVLRVLKVAKVLRVVRVLRLFSELRIMLNSIMGSFMNLFWSMFMLAFIFYLFSLVIVQGTANYLSVEGEALTEEERARLVRVWGRVEHAMLNLFKSTTGGTDWEVFYDDVISPNPLSAYLFIFFIGFMQVALMNILTGIFVDKAMKLAAPDQDMRALEKQKEEVWHARELTNLLMDLDHDGEGKILTKDLMERCQDQKFQAQLAVLGLDIKDASVFFDMLHTMSENDRVNLDGLVNSCLRLKGMATSLDSQGLLRQMQVINSNQIQFQKYCHAQFQLLSSAVHREVTTTGYSL